MHRPLNKTLLCLVAVSVFASGCAQKIDTAAEFLELAYRSERDGHFPEAVSAYLKAIELAPDRALTWYDLGVAYAATQQSEKAIKAYSKAVELDPGLARAYNNRATIYAQLKQYQRAIADCDVAIRLEPNDPLPWRNRGLGYHDLGELEKALSDYDEAIRIDGRHPETYHHRGNVYLEQNQWARAMEDFDHALHLDEQQAAVHLSRAIALAHLGRGEDAATARERAEELGADVADTNLAAADAPAASATGTHTTNTFGAGVEDLNAAVQFVRSQLEADGMQLASEVAAPWNLRDSADQNRRFAVRLLVDSSSGQNVMFQSAELEAFRAEESVRTTLIIVRVTPPSDSSETNRSIFRTIDNWSPDTDVMRPVTWSLPLSEETAGQTSDTGKTTGTDNTAGPVDVAGRR